MQFWTTVEYFIYLVIFLLYLKISEGATVDLMKPYSVDSLTTLESSLKNSSGSRLKSTLKECQNSFTWLCLKLELIRLLESLAEQDELRLANGISLVKDKEANKIKTADLMAEVARSYPNDPTARLNNYIINRVHNILQTHYLRFKLHDDQIIEEARSLMESSRREKFGKKGGMGALVAAGLMMKGILIAMGMGGIALIAGKAFITSLMALTMAVVVGLKTLASDGGKSHTYEIVTKPIYTSSHSHSVSHEDGGHGAYIGHSGSGYGGYARTLKLNLPKSHSQKIKEQ